MDQSYNVHSCIHTGSEAHPATYPRVRQVYAIHRTLRLRTCGVQRWHRQHSLAHSVVWYETQGKISFLTGMFVHWTLWPLSFRWLQCLKTSCTTQSVTQGGTSQKKVASCQVYWHIWKVSMHPTRFWCQASHSSNHDKNLYFSPSALRYSDNNTVLTLRCTNYYIISCARVTISKLTILSLLYSVKLNKNMVSNIKIIIWKIISNKCNHIQLRQLPVQWVQGPLPQTMKWLDHKHGCSPSSAAYLRNVLRSTWIPVRISSMAFRYSSAPKSMGNTFQDLTWLRETADNNEH
jgi:hypothetical protein